MIKLKQFLRRATTAACISSLSLSGLVTAQSRNNDYYQQQQRQQQEQQRQQQQAQMRQQQQDQIRQQQQEQMRQQMRQQQQDQVRQQMQQQARQQQQDQMRGQVRQQQQDQARQQARQQQQDQVRQQIRDQQQSQVRQQVRDQQANQTKQQIADQQRQLQNAQKAQLSGKPAPGGTNQSVANRTADRMVFSNGVAKLTRPLTSAEMKRGFTGKVTEDGRALVKFQNRIFTVPASRVGINPRVSENNQSVMASRWSHEQRKAISSDVKKIAALQSVSVGSGKSGGGKPGLTETFNATALRSPEVQSRIDAARLAKRDSISSTPGGIETTTSNIRRNEGSPRSKSNFANSGNLKEPDPLIDNPLKERTKPLTPIFNPAANPGKTDSPREKEEEKRKTDPPPTPEPSPRPDFFPSNSPR